MMKRVLLTLVAVAALAGCGGGGGGGTDGGGTSVTPPPAPPPPSPPPPPPPPPPSPVVARPASEWTPFVADLFEKLFVLDPPYAVQQGRHEYDGRLPDWSTSGLQQLGSFWHWVADQANAFTGLDTQQGFERAYLVQIAAGQLFWLEEVDQPHTNPAFYVGSLDPDIYLSREYADPVTRMQAATAMLEAVPAATASIRANLHLPLAAPFLSYATATFNGYATYYRNNVTPVFQAVGDPAQRTRLANAAQAAANAMTDLANYLGASAGGGGAPGFALGESRFVRMLSASEGIDANVSELESVAQADLQRNQSALSAACAQFAPGASIAACIQQMQSHAPSGSAIATATEQIAELRAFVLSRDLVTIPDGLTAGVRASPPYRGGDYFAPVGPYEKGVTAYYYVSANGGGEADRLFVTAHEVMPGHFLQFLHSNRAPSQTGRLLVTYTFAEGWAHYGEEMLWEAGLRGTAEAHVGQLANALLRNCRLLAGIGLHARGMTQAQAQNLFQQQCYQGSGTAANEAQRATYDPLVVTYTLGKLMIRRLRDDWTATRGGTAAWKAFHDQFLSYGGPPIPLVRQAMMGESAPLTRF